MATHEVLFVGYPLIDGLKRFHELCPEVKLGLPHLVQHIESLINVPVALARVLNKKGGLGPYSDYICCYVDGGGRKYSDEEALDIPIPDGFERLPELLPGLVPDDMEIHWTSASLLSFDSHGKIRANVHGLLVGDRAYRESLMAKRHF